MNIFKIQTFLEGINTDELSSNQIYVWKGNLFDLFIKRPFSFTIHCLEAALKVAPLADMKEKIKISLAAIYKETLEIYLGIN